MSDRCNMSCGACPNKKTPLFSLQSVLVAKCVLQHFRFLSNSTKSRKRVIFHYKVFSSQMVVVNCPRCKVRVVLLCATAQQTYSLTGMECHLLQKLSSFGSKFSYPAAGYKFLRPAPKSASVLCIFYPGLKYWRPGANSSVDPRNIHTGVPIHLKRQLVAAHLLTVIWKLRLFTKIHVLPDIRCLYILELRVSIWRVKKLVKSNYHGFSSDRGQIVIVTFV